MSGARRGYLWELEVQHRLESHRWMVFRCAGSKPLDLVAFRPGCVPLWIECRTSRLPPSAERTFWDHLARTTGAQYMVARRCRRSKTLRKRGLKT